MLPEILAELLLVRDISFNIHVEITDEIENKCYRIGRYLPQGVLNILTEMDRIWAKYVYVQHVAERENRWHVWRKLDLQYSNTEINKSMMSLETFNSVLLSHGHYKKASKKGIVPVLPRSSEIKTNHINGHVIDKTVYGPDCWLKTYYNDKVRI